MSDPTTEYTVTRLRNGKPMAEGAKVHAKSVAEALVKAKALFPDCPDDTFEIEEDFV